MSCGATCCCRHVAIVPLPASLDTTALKIWQVRSCMFLGNASIHIKVQPFAQALLYLKWWFRLPIPHRERIHSSHPEKLPRTPTCPDPFENKMSLLPGFLGHVQ